VLARRSFRPTRSRTYNRAGKPVRLAVCLSAPTRNSHTTMLQAQEQHAETGVADFNEYVIMKQIMVLALATLCVAVTASCAQTQLAHASLASAPPPAAEARANSPTPARFDAKWSSALVGMPVESVAGEKLGRVQDVIVDGYGRPTFAILSYGGRMAGLGAKYTAVPWETVAELLDRDRLVVNQPVLEKAPALASAGADARSGDWRRDAEHYWNGRVASAR
jgi:sporulation protein YlmC with PRC-barrel domain